MSEDLATEPIRLLPPLPPQPLPEPDEQTSQVTEQVRSGANLVVLGAAGTGKSTLALRLLVEAVAQGREALVLAPTRARAEVLRQRAAQLLAGQGGGAVRVRTPGSFAFMVLSTSLSARQDPLPAPVLLVGAEEDAALAQMLHPDDWQPLPAQAVSSRAFRSELRSLLARAGELGIGAPELAELAQELDVEIWRQAVPLLRAWDAQGRASASRRSQTRKMDSARIQDRAREALERWEEDGVQVPPPVPDLVVVDDYQDCTAATARLLACLALPDASGRRSQVVVLGDPDCAVETFRGGTPSLLVEAEDRSGLAAARMTLTTRYRGDGALARVWQDQADRVPVVGAPAHRRPQQAGATSQGVGQTRTSSQAEAAVSGVTALVASSVSQETAHVARLLRAEHVLHATGWEQMAVIVRSSGAAQSVARELRRRGVPLSASTPAVLLRAEPAGAALLGVAEAALAGRLGERSQPAQREAVLALLTSPLIGLSALDLRRVRRRLRAAFPRRDAEESLLSLVTSPEEARVLSQELAQEALAGPARSIERAARVVEAARAVVEGAQTGAGQEDKDPAATDEGLDLEGLDLPRVDVEELLWAAWEASGCAQRWREVALGSSEGAGEAVLAEAAEHDLDVVTALFKRAEVWAERHPGQDASVFLRELASEVVPSDSVAPTGVRPEGVSVLTPAAAAGREWEVVAVTGLNRDQWPDLRLRDSLTRAGLLVEAVTDRLPRDPEGLRVARADTVAARAQVRGDERRMLLASLTRATRRLLVTSCQDEEHSPSSFFMEVARSAGAQVANVDGEVLTSPDVGELTLRGLTGELRHAVTAGGLPQATAEQRQAGCVAGEILNQLAQAGVVQADSQWWSGAPVTSVDPLVATGQRVRVSPSDVDNVATCPLRWFLQRHGGDNGASSQQALGTIVHAVAERAQREGLRGQVLHDLLTEQMPQLAEPLTWLEQLQARRAHDVIDRLDAYLGTVPGPVAVEKRVDVELDLPLPTDPGAGGPQEGAARGQSEIGVRLVGRVDRIELDDGEDSSLCAPDAPELLPPAHGTRVRVMDLKTGRRPAGEAARNAQLATYRMALAALGYEVTGAGLVVLGEEADRYGDTRVYPAGAALAASPDPESGKDWAAELVACAARDASGSHFEARVGAHCRFCSVKSACPAVPEGRRNLA
ncbi:PD-(D/E)XK nuclease family protein [Actinomyces faecalis]|uniref:PD-(D/E)XK nuclease family protein n=1 Tax=Actinomyces faecalis TaxID=2722820 RepID=UPI0015530D26|nr:PD-(D/E)XK nuclease family protein [Actinomyces faecalis]